MDHYGYKYMQQNRDYGRADPLRRPRDTYPQTLAIISPTSGGRLVGTVRLWTNATKFSWQGSIFYEMC
jgi:hypothetical protein